VSVVQNVDSAIHWINLYPVDNPIGFPNTYLLDCDLSGGWCCPHFEQLGPGVKSRFGGFICLFDFGCLVARGVGVTNYLNTF